MALYFCINDVLDLLDKMNGNEDRLQALIPVSVDVPECGGFSEDAFILSSTPKMLDLREPQCAVQLAQLLEDVPLYHINLELILDQALAERHNNVRIEYALNQAFGREPLPNTLSAQKSGSLSDDIAGGLQHPMLGHLNREALAELYIIFLKAMDRAEDHYGFERSILGKNTNRFTAYFDGFATATGGKVKAAILLAFGLRCDHDPAKSRESYIESGQKNAQRMRIDDTQELIWAWLEADHYQMRRCRDLDRLLRLEGLPKLPNWVSNDIFSCLEKEAMKQTFAAGLVQKDGDLAVLGETPLLQAAIKRGAEGHADPDLQKLLSETLTPGATYTGTAHGFAEQAEKRKNEARRAQLR